VGEPWWLSLQDRRTFSDHFFQGGFDFDFVPTVPQRQFGQQRTVVLLAVAVSRFIQVAPDEQVVPPGSSRLPVKCRGTPAACRMPHPMRYAFAEEVALYHKEPGEVHENGGGWTVKPHWRRGHWRSQPCGPGRSERRRIAIPSVLVNGQLMVAGT